MKTFIVVRTHSETEADELLGILQEVLGANRAMKGKKLPSEILIRTEHNYMKKIEAEITRFSKKNRKHGGFYDKSYKPKADY